MANSGYLLNGAMSLSGGLRVGFDTPKKRISFRIDWSGTPTNVSPTTIGLYFYHLDPTLGGGGGAYSGIFQTVSFDTSTPNVNGQRLHVLGFGPESAIANPSGLLPAPIMGVAADVTSWDAGTGSVSVSFNAE